MPISLSKKKCKTPPKKLVEQKKCCSSLTNFVSYLYRLPIAISLLLLIYLWSSSSTIISGKIVHVCVSSRKLNSLYCLSAGTQPNFEIPIPTLDNATTSTAELGSTSSETLEKDLQSLKLEKDISNSPFVTLELEKEVPSDPIADTSTYVDLELEKEIPSSPNVDNSTIESPIVNNLGLENDTPSKSIVDNTTFNHHPTLELEKEIPNSPIVESSNIGSAIFNLGLENEISNAPITDNSTSESPNVNLGLEKQILNSSIIGNGTNGSPIANLGLEKDYFATNLEVTSPIDNYTTASSPIVDKEGEINVLELVGDSNSQSGSDSSNDGKENEIGGELESVEQIMQEIRAWTAKKTKKSCDNRGIYVYDLPSKFNKDLLGQCENMVKWIDFCKYLTNGGLGEPISKLGPSWYKTHMYALEPIFHARALNHPCRVKNQTEAKLFYVPFYGGFDVLRWHFKNVTVEVKDGLGLELVRYLSSQPAWTRNSGKDHVFALGKISWDFRRAEGFSWGTSLLELPEMQSPAKVLIERQPWRANDIGVPHPTYFHPRSDSDVLTWQAEVVSSGRPHIACFAGAARPKSPENIRTRLMQQCSAAGDGVCRILDCNSGKGCGEPEELVVLFKESEFCLQPPGDSPTRRSVFDSLVSGCIPVLFDPFTAYYQYPWHLPEDRRKYSVFIDQRDVREKGVNVIDVLKGISKEERDSMRRFIVYDIMPGLVYADPDSRLETFRDAFSITVDSLVDRVNGLL